MPGARDAIAAQPVLCGWTGPGRALELDIYPRFKPRHCPITDVMDLGRPWGDDTAWPCFHCPENWNWGPRPCPVSRPGTPYLSASKRRPRRYKHGVLRTRSWGVWYDQVRRKNASGNPNPRVSSTVGALSPQFGIGIVDRPAARARHCVTLKSFSLIISLRLVVAPTGRLGTTGVDCPASKHGRLAPS